jgi:hypothetical protein
LPGFSRILRVAHCYGRYGATLINFQARLRCYGEPPQKAFVNMQAAVLATEKPKVLN